MKLYQVTLKDILRRKKRVLYATLGVVIATMTVIGILTIARAGEARIVAQLEKYGANLSVLPAARSLSTGLGDLTLGTVTIGETYIPAEKIPDIRKITDSEIKKSLNILDEPGNIASIAPQLIVQATVKGTPVIVVGVDPAEEVAIKTWWQVQKGKSLDAPDEALIGSTVAEVLQLDIGDTIALNDSKVTVAGILAESGSADDSQIFVPLQTAQTAFGKEGLVSMVNIRALCTACPVEIIADAINNDLTGVRAVAVKQVAATEMGMLEKINTLMLALAGVTLIVGGFGVVNALMNSVQQRIKDIGIMRAVGASRNQIVRAFIYEALIIGIGGGILGFVAGSMLAYGIGPLIFEGSSVIAVPNFLPMAILLAVFLAVVATLYPAFSATKIRVADSFRSL